MKIDSTSDHQRISFTAKLVALGRSVTEIPFAREVSELIGAEQLGQDLARSAGATSSLPSFMVPFVEARYMSLVSAIKRSGVKQVLEFASGVSLRGLAMTIENKWMTYVETDLRDLTIEKQSVVKNILERRHLVRPQNHHIAEANILSWNEIEAACEIFDSTEPLAIVHEGLFMYLTPEEKTVAGTHISRILDKFGGVWITPDFSPMDSMSWLMDETTDEFSKVMSTVETRTGRSFATHAYTSEEEAVELCDRLGLHVEVRPQIDGSFELSGGSRKLPPAILHRLEQTLKIWEMRRVHRK